MAAPAPVDCQILQFRQLCKLKTCPDLSKNVYLNPTQLIATSSLHGITFVGERCGFKLIINGKVFENVLNPKNAITSYTHRNIQLPSAPSHIDINSDQQFLSVAFCKNEIPFLFIYEIRSLLDSNPSVFSEIQLSSASNTFVTDISWNPAIPNMLTCCISDRTLSVYTFNPNGNFETRSLPKESNSMCVCWSPKGKQLAVGNYNGYLTQYLPELKAMKNYPPPSHIFDKPCSLCSVKWLSNFQFIGVYKLQTPNDDDGDSKTSVIIINTSKNEPVSFINYEDICFSSGTERPCQFYFVHITAWNIIFVASSNAVEVSVLKLNPDSVSWSQWMLEDSARITLPMSGVNETFPVGVAVDYSSSIQAPIGETVAPMPIISVLTCEGLLCLYLIHYLDLNVPNVCVRPSIEPQLQYFTNNDVTNGEVEMKPAQRTVPVASIAAVNASHTPNLPSQPVTSSVLSTASEMKNFESQTVNKASLPPLLGASVNLANLSRLTNQVSPSINVAVSSPNITASNAVASPINQKQEVIKAPTAVIDTPAPVPKSVLQSRARQECLKKFKKTALTFENDILEIKELVVNISIDGGNIVLRNERLEKLKADAKHLMKLKSELSSEVDSVKISLVEVFACIQDIKTKYFQMNNPGYRTLFGAQDMDPVNATNLKNIENKINYVESQLEKANQQLDEFWCKYTEHSSPSRMKIPVLDNVYETMMRQQKILKILELQTERVQKRISAVKCQVKSSQWMQNKKEMNTFANRALDDITLAEFAQKALNIKADYSDSEVTLNDAKTLTRKFSLEHAKRFHISNAKQLKLQELHNSSSVTYIQSSRLQRLKKKSLILLSKSAYTAESAVEDGYVTTLASSLPIHKNVEELRLQMVSPVSSVEDGLVDQVSLLEYPTSQGIVSSTPVKNGDKFVMPRFAAEPSISVDMSLPLPPIMKTTVAVSKTESDAIFASATITLPIQAKSKLTQSVTVNPLPSLGAATITASTIDSVKPLLIASSASKDTVSLSLSKNLNNSESVTTSNSISKTLFSGEVTISPVGGAGDNVTSTAVPIQTPSFFPKTLSATSAQVPVSSLGNSFFGSALGSSSSLAKTSSFFSNITTTSPTVVTTTSNAPVSLFSGTKLGSGGGTLFGSSGLVSSNVSVISNTAKVSPFSSLGNLNASPASPITTSTQTLSTSTSLFPKSSVTISSTSTSTISGGTSTIFGGTGSIFGKAGSTSTSSINFGNALPPANSLFGVKAQEGPTDLTPASNDKKTSAFSTFNFASKPAENTPVPILEVPPVSALTEGVDADKENGDTVSVAAVASLPAATFSFASISTAGFAPVKSSLFSTLESSSAAPEMPTTTMPVASVAPAITTSENTPLLASILSVPVSSASASGGNLFANTPTSAETVVPTLATTPSPIATTLAPVPQPVATAGASVPVIEPITPVPSPTPVILTSVSPDIGAINVATPSTFESKGSFFEGLSLGVTTTTPGATSSVFGKSTTDTTSVFGGNLFTQIVTTSAPTPAPNAVAGETKSIFGGSSMFGTSNATNTESQNIFGGTVAAASPGSFGENQTTSIFGSSSLFGSTSTFGSGGANAAPQPNSSFNSSSGGMLFPGAAAAGSFSSPSNSLFQSTASGFGSPASFGGGGIQPTQNTSGFGSPPSFSSVFNKSSTFSTFGGAPTFGGSATFGASPTKVFGQPAASQGTFGNVAGQQPTAFENLASENTMTFGNLAQQQTPGFVSPPSFGGGNPQPSFGQSNFGSSFSSWR